MAITRRRKQRRRLTAGVNRMKRPLVSIRRINRAEGGDAIAERYLEWWKRYKAGSPDFSAMKMSRSTGTDPYVWDMLRWLGVPADQVNRDAMALVREVWGEAMAVTELPPRLQRMKSVGFVAERMRDGNRIETLRDIAEAKEAYHNVAQPPHLERRPCEILTCWRPGSAEMNNRLYCDRHIGLAILNGLRHSRNDCKACMLWSIVGLKGDAGIGGHAHNTDVTYESPMVDLMLDTEGKRVRIRRFCSGGNSVWTSHVTPEELRFVSGTPKAYYLDANRRRREVPRHSWCLFGTKRVVTAWIHMEALDVRDERWRPVKTMDQLTAVIKRLGWRTICKQPEEENPWAEATGWPTRSGGGGW